MSNPRATNLARAAAKGLGAATCGSAAFVAWQLPAFFGPVGYIAAVALGGTAAGLGISAAKNVKAAIKNGESA